MKVQSTTMVARSRPFATENRQRVLPLSGNIALAAAAAIQAVLGIEFLLNGLNKLSDPNYASNFAAFVRSSPGAHRGLLSGVIQALIVPNLTLAAVMARTSELAIGVVLLVAAIEVARRRFGGKLGSPHAYEPWVALAVAGAALGMSGLTFTIFMIQGGVLPSINPARAFSSSIPVELLLVPLGLAIAWLQAERFLVMRAALRMRQRLDRSHPVVLR